MTAAQCQPLTADNYEMCCIALNRTELLRPGDLAQCPPLTTALIRGVLSDDDSDNGVTTGSVAADDAWSGERCGRGGRREGVGEGDARTLVEIGGLGGEVDGDRVEQPVDGPHDLIDEPAGVGGHRALCARPDYRAH